MEDGARENTTKLTRKRHKYNKINLLLSSLGISHDLDPIKNVWGFMKRVLSWENPTTIDDNKKVVAKFGVP